MQENLCNATAICCNCSMFSHDCLYIPGMQSAWCCSTWKCKKQKDGSVCLLSMMHFNFKVTEKRCMSCF